MDDERQRIVRVAGSRRAKLTRVEGTTSEPHERAERSAPAEGERGPNDERMLREVPPHY
ncbi:MULTISPECIES: hypothetical protein [unclassified Microbacterium]|uniref:hypothetical protein n=1 Tax=unclassified Microbacterium TaxID=2609290 RepID=UPI002305D7B8|nr:hypothetical protein [Microbacterium sp. nov. GSS16]WCD91596.1 hypothetical protein PGB26_07765 [Microbacterium sp. nov. GSS16]